MNESTTADFHFVFFLQKSSPAACFSDFTKCFLNFFVLKKINLLKIMKGNIIK